MEGQLFNRIFSYFPPMGKDERTQYLKHHFKHKIFEDILGNVIKACPKVNFNGIEVEKERLS